VDKFCEAIDHPFTDLLVGLAAVAIDTSSSSVPTDKGVTCDLRHVGRSDQVETQLPSMMFRSNATDVIVTQQIPPQPFAQGRNN